MAKWHPVASVLEHRFALLGPVQRRTISPVGYPAAMVNMIENYSSLSYSQLCSVKKDITRQLKSGRKRGNAAREITQEERETLNEELLTVETASSKIAVFSQPQAPRPANPYGSRPISEVRSRKQNPDTAPEESHLGAASSSIEPITAKLSSMEVADEEVSGIEQPAVPLVKRSKPTRVPIFKSEDLLAMTTNLQNTEKQILDKIVTWRSMKEADEETDRSTAWLDEKLAIDEARLQKVRNALENAAIEKELIAAANEKEG